MFGAVGGFDQGFGDPLEIADRHFLGEQRLQDLADQPHRKIGPRLFGQTRRGFRQPRHQPFHLRAAEQVGAVALQNFREMRGDRARGVHHRIAQLLGLRDGALRDPDGGLAESRVFDRAADGQLLGHHRAFDGEPLAGPGLAAADGRAAQA